MAFSDNEVEAVVRVVELLSASRSLLFITGAGISADSGLPTYRGIGGLYDVEVTEEGIPIEEVLSGRMMQVRPELTWKYLAEIGRAALAARFNRGHEVIAEMEAHFERRRLPSSGRVEERDRRPRRHARALLHRLRVPPDGQ